MKALKVSAFLSLIHAAVGFGFNPIHCHDEMSFGAGQIHLEKVTDKVSVKMRTADFYPARTKDLANQLGIQVDGSRMPLWAEVEFPASACRQKENSPVTVCSGADIPITFKDYFEETVVGVTKGQVIVTVDTFTRNSLFKPNHEKDRIEAHLIVTNDQAYHRSAIVEASDKFCEK